MVDSAEQPVKEETVRNEKRAGELGGVRAERRKGEKSKTETKGKEKARKRGEEREKEREKKRLVWALARFSCLAFEGVFRP
ncbi:hypothetical protein WH47_02749 [Habropoda laboriosa]|uniref:Uncharacterized protein n=1 Tax=Habropoda laboriosa TaxID=597456 RepID=A0A0L7QXA6_9HYME|nr:hypothetical protein WH47_02749 [Habropoda laboriosa]